MKIISIDPGYERLGIAILEREKNGKEKLIFSSCIRTSAKSPFPERLKIIGDSVLDCIQKYKPDAMAIESLYFAGNQKTAIAVAGARGVILYCAAKENIPVREFTPLQVKIAVTGYGRASKEDVAKMVPKLISLSEKIRIDDEIDAIAIGLTALAHQCPK